MVLKLSSGVLRIDLHISKTVRIKVVLQSFQKFQVAAAADRPLRRVPYAHRATDVDGQRDKLVTDDGHQFITLTIHRS